MSRRKTKRTVILSLLLLGVLAVIALSLLIDRAYIQRLAFEYIERAFGPHIAIGRADLSLFPQPRLELTEVVVKERHDAHAIFRARSLSMEFEIWPLLHQSLKISSLVIRRPEVELRRDKDGRWHLFSEETSSGTMATSLLSVRHLIIATGHVTIIDERPEEGIRGLLLDDLHVEWTVEQDRPHPIVDLKLASKVRSRDHAAALALMGRLEPHPLEPGSGDSPKGSPALPLSFTGRFEAQDLAIDQILEVLAADNGIEMKLGRADIRGLVKIVPGASGYEISLLDLIVHSPLASFTGTIHVGGVHTDEMTVSIVGSSTPISLQEMKQKIPLAWIPDSAQPFWQNADISGTIEVIQATIIGPTRSALGISVNGEVKINDVSVRSATDEWPPIEHVSGKLLLEPDRIRCLDFTGIYDGQPVESARAVILLKDSGPWMEMHVQGMVSGEKVLAAFQEVLGRADPASPILSWEVLQGEGRLSLHFAGYLQALEHPFENIALQEGTYVITNLALRLPRAEIVLSDIAGQLRFSADETAFEAINGWIGPHFVRLDGAIDTRAAPVFDNLVLLVKANADRLTTLGAPDWLNRWVSDGDIDSRFVFSGPLRAPTIKGELDFGQVALQFSPIVEKVKGVPGSLEFEGKLGSRGDFIVDRAELLVLPLRVSGRGVFRFSPELAFRAKIDTGSIYVGLLPEGLTLADGVLQSGILEVSLALSGRGQNWRTWRTRGWVALTEGVMVAKGLDHPLSHLFLRVKLDSRLAELKRCDFRLGDSDVRLTGIIQNWKAHPDITLAIESERFDIDQLIPKGERSPLRDVLEIVAAETTVNMQVAIVQPWYRHIRLRNLSCVVTMHDSLIKVDRLEAGTKQGNGTVAGRILLHLPRAKPGAMRVSMTVNNFPFEDIEKTFERGQRLITGRLTATGMIQGHGRHPQGVWRTLQGNLHVKLIDGRVRRGTILPRILAILNLPTILQGQVDLTTDGFPFHQAQATLRIEQGAVKSEDFIVDSPIMKLTAAGSYDLVQDRLDAVAAVSPFGPYSKLLQSIPLFGKILTGERKGIATALFKIQGPLNNPVVTYMPLESLTTGLSGLAQLAFDILKNTVMLPTELLPGKPSEDSGSTAPTSPAQVPP